jgi:hypothetical protein
MCQADIYVFIQTNNMTDSSISPASLLYFPAALCHSAITLQRRFADGPFAFAGEQRNRASNKPIIIISNILKKKRDIFYQ